MVIFSAGGDGSGGPEKGDGSNAGGDTNLGKDMAAGAAFRESIRVKFKKGAGEAFDKCFLEVRCSLVIKVAGGDRGGFQARKQGREQGLHHRRKGFPGDGGGVRQLLRGLREAWPPPTVSVFFGTKRARQLPQ
jgi:hypothetical protein